LCITSRICLGAETIHKAFDALHRLWVRGADA
jgi:hypothetical protein